MSSIAVDGTMSPIPVIAAVFSAVYACLAAWHIVRLPLRWSSKAILGLLRAALLGLLWIAFFEPTLVIEQLRALPPTTLVLVDQSQSMQLFAPESAVVPFLRALKMHADTSRHPRLRLKMYGFGDSLRPLRDLQSLRFNDRASDFPASLPAELLEPSTAVLIISDGNWTNTLYPHGNLETRLNYYAELPAWRGRPFVHARVAACLPSTQRDCANSATIEISSYLPSPTPLSIICTERGVSLSRRTLQCDSGFQQDTVIMKLPSSRAGRHFFVFRVVQEPESTLALCHAVQDIVPGRFLARCYSARPSLDRRFLSLALQRAPEWSLLGERDTTAHSHALFIFTWDAKARNLIERSDPATTVTFAGALPCPARRAVPSSSFSIVLCQDAYLHRFLRPPASLPPPASLYFCSPAPLSGISILLNAVNSGTAEAPDTIPLLYTGRFMRRWVIALSAYGFWRWDFWTIGVGQPRQETPRFSDILLDMTKHRIMLNASDAYYAYPSRVPLLQGDSLLFTLALPARAEEARNVRIRTTIRNLNGETLADTTLTAPPFNNAALRMLPLNIGRYPYTSELQADEEVFRYADTLQVVEDQSEFMIRNMNTVLLGQIAQPLSLADHAAAIARLTNSEGQDKRLHPIKQHIDLKQDWWLLLMIILIFSIEWILRKRWEID